LRTRLAGVLDLAQSRLPRLTKVIDRIHFDKERRNLAVRRQIDRGKDACRMSIAALAATRRVDFKTGADQLLAKIGHVSQAETVDPVDQSRAGFLVHAASQRRNVRVGLNAPVKQAVD
jgi:hypothetical protein